ncbi:MAG: hypothetical protein HYY02_09590 [Chloroflexi bacterium]|nr:hypothetical protein [Chloroflexota bacterium]
MVAEEAFEAVAQHLLVDPGITRAKMFGAPTLKVGSKVFACLYKGRLVVKLPRAQVDALVRSGQGEHFDPGMGRIMKEWVALEHAEAAAVQHIMEQARDFVAGDR